MRKLVTFAVLLMLSTSAIARKHVEEPDPPPADKATLIKIEPGKTTYNEVLQLLGPPNEVTKNGEGNQQLIYTGSRQPLRQHVGMLLFGWDKESPGAPFRTVITVHAGLVESLTAN